MEVNVGEHDVEMEEVEHRVEEGEQLDPALVEKRKDINRLQA